MDDETCNVDENIEFNDLPSDEVLEKKSNVFKAISDPTRLKILYLLEDTELCPCQIQDALDKPQPTISHHVTILKNANLIKGRKDGIWIYFTLVNKDIIKILDLIV